MPTRIKPSPTNFWDALGGMIAHPIRSIAPPWSWKAAAFTAAFRGITFFATNMVAGHNVALRAMAVEACYSIFAGGLAGAISQQLRKTKPLGATLLVILGGLPAAFVAVQYGLHRLAQTPRVAGGLVLSFLLTSLSSGFSWFAMRHDAMLGGVDETSVRDDLRVLPGIALQFLLAIPRALMGWGKKPRITHR